MPPNINLRSHLRQEGHHPRRPRRVHPTSSQKYLPGFVEKAVEFMAKGIDTIVCVFLNNVFVIKAWKANLKIGDEVLLLSDSSGRLLEQLGASSI
ncbi:Peroxiredoxin-2E- chloroplastic [Striga hermonthica]|uniref:Peroxiredoxin-2E- chloroplastic n=1 Tax=Striga hermonthica TaxID=68872 RepID=A0A9N7MRY8_STRHE|nr:Peroxiredoxin-2E- chloroplastic [Striga hermonthica]